MSAFPTGASPVILAVDGRSGAGKSTLASRMTQALRAEGEDVELFHVEDVYRGWSGLRSGLDHYVHHVLSPLRQGLDAAWYAWDWAADAVEPEARLTRCADVILCEGVGAGCPQAVGLLSARLTLSAPASVRKARALARDGETFRPHWDGWAAQEAALPTLPDAVGDLTLDVGCQEVPDVGHQELLAPALAWARGAITAARR